MVPVFSAGRKGDCLSCPCFVIPFFFLGWNVECGNGNGTARCLVRVEQDSKMIPDNGGCPISNVKSGLRHLVDHVNAKVVI